MQYKIIITKNGKRKKILYEGSNEKIAKEKYFSTKDVNKGTLRKMMKAYKLVK